MEKDEKIAIKIAVGVIFLAIFLIVNPFVIISAGHRGVLMNWGAVSDTILGEGIHLRIPIQQKVFEASVQVQKMETQALAYSKDIQTVDSLIALNYHQQDDKVNSIYQNLGRKFEETYISPAIQESVKAITARYTAQELIEKREVVRDEIKALVEERLQPKGLLIDAFSIVNFDFSDSYENSVEQKQVAQQNALKAENDLKRIKTEAEQRIAQAEGEARAIKIQAEAITQQGGKDYVSLKWIEAWATGGAQVPQYIVGDGSNFLFNLNK